MAGASKVPITPGVVGGTPVYPDGSPVYLGGYGSWPEPATYVHDELYATTLALSYGDKTLVLVSLDLVGLFWHQVEMIRNEAEKLGLDRNYIMIATTHSHASPDTLGLWTYDPPGVNDEYMEYIRNQTILSIKEALDNMKPARLKFASIDVPGVVRNTRDQAEKYAVTYPELTVMKVEDLDGKTIATLINFAAHPEILGPDNREISRDFVYYLCLYVEENLGGIAIYFNGAQGGMITPDIDGVFDGQTTPGLPPQHTYEMCEEVGYRIAKAAIEALSEAGYSDVIPEISVDRRVIKLPLENPLFYAAMLMELIDRPEYDPTYGYLGVLTTEICVIWLGEAQFVTIPGEALPSIGHRIKMAMTGEYKFVIGLCNDIIGYIIPEEEWDWNGTWIDIYWTGKYEESMSVGPMTAVVIEGTIMEMISEIIAEGKGSVYGGDPWYHGSTKLYINNVITIKVSGYIYDPEIPWWYIYPRPKEWTSPWVQWIITKHYISPGLNLEYFLGQNNYGTLIVVKQGETIWAFGGLAVFKGSVI